MPRLPSQLTYNDLNGREACEILVDWFRQLIQSNPQFQPHLTLPNAKFTLDIAIAVDMYPGGTVPVASPPERLDIAGAVTLTNESHAGSNVWTGVAPGSASPGATLAASEPPASAIASRLTTEINAAPIPGGEPPDVHRARHNLPITRPGIGPRDIGAHVQIVDVPNEETGAVERLLDTSDGDRHGIVRPGYVFSKESNAAPVEQTIPLGDGAIEIDLSGRGTMRQGSMIVTAGEHRASAKTAGDGKGAKYGSVSSTYDPGPAGLANPSRGAGGLGSDGRPRLSFDKNGR